MKLPKILLIVGILYVSIGIIAITFFIPRVAERAVMLLSVVGVAGMCYTWRRAEMNDEKTRAKTKFRKFQ